MEDISCSHLDDFLSTPMNIARYEHVYGTFVKPANRTARLKKALLCSCNVCTEHSPRLHACLYCVYFGCYEAGHIQDHAKNKQHLHAIDVNHGNVFCFECNDYTYSKAIFNLTEPLKNKWEDSLSLNRLYRKWLPTYSDLNLFAAHPERRGICLRGLNNNGSTCFINCIVQVLIATPFLKTYFLSDLHECTIGAQCLVCEFGDLYQKFFSIDKTPLNLDKLIYIIWNQARHMAGYKQQDSQEFFITTLDVLHRHCEGQINEAKTYHSSDCSCIIDKIFSGALQSDVVCQACKNVSTTVDPFWDISLDLGNDTYSLVDCLLRFTRAEHLGAIKCSKCNSYEESTKQLTMKTLPLVASFHLKRFEHSEGEKIVRQISFPAELDMSPFLSHSRNRTLRDAPSPRYSYQLFAVTNHLGSMNGGHYIAYVNHSKQTWFKCNDHFISKVSLSDVLASQAYQLFYHKNELEYE